MIQFKQIIQHIRQFVHAAIVTNLISVIRWLHMSISQIRIELFECEGVLQLDDVQAYCMQGVVDILVPIFRGNIPEIIRNCKLLNNLFNYYLGNYKIVICNLI